MLCFCGMMVCILIELVGRNLLQLPTTWAEESSRLFCVWTVFLGAASAWHRNAHIVIQVLSTRLKGWAKQGAQIMASVLTGIFLVSIWFGTLLIMKISYHSKTTALEISISYFYLGLFLGISGMIIFHFNILAGLIRKATGERI
jgi:TRAP-type C4-dicarboxylate transport system permease small subunit